MQDRVVALERPSLLRFKKCTESRAPDGVGSPLSRPDPVDHPNLLSPRSRIHPVRRRNLSQERSTCKQAEQHRIRMQTNPRAHAQ